MKKLILILSSLLFLSSCAHNEIKKETITFQKAMESIANGLNVFTKKKKEERIFGIVPSEIEATFNISVSKTNKGETSLTLDPTNIITGFLSKWNSEVISKNSNKITIKFRNLLFAKKGEAFYDKKSTGDDIKKLKDGGFAVQKKSSSL